MHLQAAPAVSFQLWASTLTSTVSRPTLCSDLIFSDEFYMADQPERLQSQCESWMKSIQNCFIQLLGQLKISVFLSGHYDFFLLHPNQNQSTFIEQQGFFKILMITLVSRKFLVCLYHQDLWEIPENTKFFHQLKLTYSIPVFSATLNELENKLKQFANFQECVQNLDKDG